MSDKLNKLEKAILHAEDSAEDARWAQAEEVVKRLDAGETQREVAASWINLRTGNPYDHRHVSHCAGAWREFGEEPPQDRPPFTVAYDKVANKGGTRVERAQAQAPTTEATAEKLVQNIMEKAPPEVIDTVYHGLREARQDKYVAPVDRKAREATADDATEPMESAVASFATMGIRAHLEQALDELREVRSLDGRTAEALHALISEIEHEIEVKAAMSEVYR